MNDRTKAAESSARTARPGARRRVALLGAGYIADWHARALASVEGVELAAICDTSALRAEALARKHGIPAQYRDLEAMLAREDLDAVHVLLPPDLHFRGAEAVLNAGRHVFLEKPMCGTAAECDALVRLAQARHLALGVGHNFLFTPGYERVRRAVRDGSLGWIDHLAISWHRELPQATHGPFDTWMLRDPRNIALEIGSHCAAHVLDLVGVPERLRAHASRPLALPTGVPFFRRWHVGAERGDTAVDLSLSFVPGFAEHRLHVRGSLGSATVDFLRSTATIRRHAPLDEDFDRYRMVQDEAADLRRQARGNLGRYVASKLHLHPRGNPFLASIAAAMDAFYAGLAGGALDERVRGETGAAVIRLCEEIGRAAVAEDRPAPAVITEPRPQPTEAPPAPAATTLVLGATGFIGTELVRQLVAAGERVRVLARSPAKLPPDLRVPLVEAVRGDLGSSADLQAAMEGIACVYHLARASANTWAEYQRDEIEVARRVGECALAAGVKRLVYTGTIDSYYAGAHGGTISEATGLDPRVERRNLYARAKAASEELLARMHRERGLPLVIVRPGIVVGRGASPFHWGIGMWWNDALCQIWGRGENQLPLVLVGDVARALVAAARVPGIEGESFNLVGDVRLTAREYLDEVDRAGSIRVPRLPTPIWRFYLLDVFKYVVKVLVRHPGRRRPMYRDWESRTQLAPFDCSRAKARLSWSPVADRGEFVRQGIRAPVLERMR